ncbi:hypothetical protein EYR36_008041 [Pleurotus pulmonarius]|nr:hypothetical protein EYR36_008041 [Pleurotus pulmonarius]
MCINITCTTAIAWRIYRATSPLIKQTRLKPVLLAIVESGALYASSVLALMITYASGSGGLYPAFDVVTPLVGITFCLIVLQIQFHLTSNAWNTNEAITINTVSIVRSANQHGGEGMEEHTFAYAMQPLAEYKMVWVSNQSGTCLNVSISSAHTSGGNPGFFPVEHELENWSVNHWNRAAAPVETAVVQLRNTSVTITGVKGNDLLLIYSNAYLKVPDVEVQE